MTNPIRPDEVADLIVIPDVVIEVFNKLIIDNYIQTSKSSTVSQEAAVMALIKSEAYTREEVFAKNLLEIEPLYRKNGWDVKFDRPGYNESYEAFWIFKRK